MRSFDSLREKTLTPAEKKKREEIAKAIEKDDPDMPMDKKMAIATATAKRVAEYGGPKISRADYLKKGKEYHAEGFTPKEIKMAIGVASDKRYAGGNYTGAVKAIEKIKKGLSKHKQVAAVLRSKNEAVSPAQQAAIAISKKERGEKPKNECASEVDFKPHMMYNPKTGEGVKANTYADHIRLDKKGYTHEKPKGTVKESMLNELAMPRKDFDKLNKGDEVTITYDSSIRKGTTTTFVVKGKSRSAKYNVDKIQMYPKGKPGGMKYFLYSRGGKDATLALGDMAAVMTKIVKEGVELEEMNVSKQTNKELMMFYRKYKGKKGEIIRSVTKELIKRGLIKEEEVGKTLSQIREAYYRGQRKATPKKQEPPKMGSKSSSGYDLYHKSYSAAMQHAYAWAKKKGHEVDMDDVDRQVAMGPKKPSDGKTNSFTLKLKNNPKKKLAVQVYGMGGGKYELNTYIT